MVTTTVRPETGAVGKAGPMITVPPEQMVQDQQFHGFAAGSGLGGAFLADQLSAFLAHERTSLNLLRTLQARTDNPALRSRYAELQGETLRAVDTWERLIRGLGGNTQYASPAGRTTEALDNKVVEALLLSGSADPLTFEQAAVQTYLAGANQSVANAALLTAFAQEADDGAAREALTTAANTLSQAAAAHAEWATDVLRRTAVAQAKHPTIRKVGQAAEKAVDAVRNAVTPG